MRKISNIYVFSTTPNWKPAQTDIRMTRLKDLDKDEIILYKVITWEICRLEAFNVEPQNLTNSQAPTSIKLIMNPSQMQIALKKKLSGKTNNYKTLCFEFLPIFKVNHSYFCAFILKISR